LGIANYESPENIHRLDVTEKVDPVHYFDKDGQPMTDIGPGPYLVRWETSPVLQTSRVNANIFQELEAGEIAQKAINRQAAMLSEFVVAPPGPPSSTNPLTAFIAAIRSMREGKQVKYLGDPLAYMIIPVYDTFDQETRKIVAVVKAALQWKLYFANILPSNVNGITVVLHNACSGSFTYEIQDNQTFGVGYGDLHDRQFDRLERSASVDLNVVEDGTDSIIWDQSDCPYSLSIYPSQKYYQDFVTSDPINVTFAVGMVFFYTIILFLFYDRLVESRQRLILAKATKSTAIVSSLFPKNVRDRLLQVDDKPSKGGGMFAMAPNQRLKTFLGNDGGEGDDNAAPIADLFPHCTVMFADISGFTAWSSTREPAQVFLLLQAVYQAFDTLAKRRRVFKVETIGDSYVAVTGLPEPQANHAVIMARFAGECLQRLQEITKELEVSLGPDTGDLGMRVGLHSGPVTAGVLRGDRARFQLFGDTVNTGTSKVVLYSWLVIDPIPLLLLS
jgi:Adenylate and Guanylate cyclase catalytic domain